MTTQIYLWEILVPTLWKESKPVRTKHHKSWDTYVRKVAGGLTVMKPVKGQWLKENVLYDERVIPVRIACTKDQIDKIAKFSLTHYEQKAIMYYKLSNEVYFVEKE